METYAFDWEPVYDPSGVDYLYTRVSLVVRCMINGQAEVLNPVPGVPFNGPPISYAFDKLRSSVVTEQSTKGSTEELRNNGGVAVLKGGAKIDVAGAAAGFNQDAAVPAAGKGGRAGTAFGAAAGGVAGGAKAIPLPGARLPNPVTPPEAFRPLPAPVVTQRNSPNARVTEMNVTAGTGTDAVTRSTLRQIVRVSNAAPLTHITIRHRLGTPRGKLYVFSGPGQESGVPLAGSNDPPGPLSQLIVQSPQNKDWPTDCKNGPTPKVLGVHTALGDANTLLVDWQCETFVNEADLNDVSVWGALLSNRFSQTQAVKSDGYSVIGTAGTALFRSDFVYALPESPDLKRPILFMPIPQGFTREIEYVRGREDAIGVDYAYSDTQVSTNFVAGVYVGAASVSAVHRQAIVAGESILSGALTTYERVLNLMAAKNWAKDPPPHGAPKGVPDPHGFKKIGDRFLPVVPPKPPPLPRGRR